MSRMDRMASDLNRNGPVERDIEQVLSSTFFCHSFFYFISLYYSNVCCPDFLIYNAFIAMFLSNQCSKRINEVVEFLSVSFYTAVSISHVF